MDFLRHHNVNEMLGLPTKFRDNFPRENLDTRERRWDNREWFNREMEMYPWMHRMNRDFDHFNRMDYMNRDWMNYNRDWNTRCEHNLFWRDCNRCCDMFRERTNMYNPWMNRDFMNRDWMNFNREMYNPWMNRDFFNRDFNRMDYLNRDWMNYNRDWNTRCEHNLFWRDCNRCDRRWDNRWIDNNMLCNTNFRPSSEAEYHTLRNPIRNYDRNTRGLWLCFDLRGFRPEEVTCTFDRKERCIIIEACHETKDLKEHQIMRKFYRKYYLPEYMKNVDLTKMELRCFFGPDCFFYVEGVLPHMNFESWPMPCEFPYFGGWDWMRNWDCRDHRDNRECWDSNRCFRRVNCKYI